MPGWLLTGALITVYGMGIVFLMLTLLWALITLLLRADVPAGIAVRGARSARRPRTGDAAPADTLDPSVAAAVMIAVRAHIRVRRKQAAPAMRAHAPGSLPSRWVSVGRGRQTRLER